MPITQLTWARNSPSLPEHLEYMEIFPDRGRIVIACAMGGDPVRFAPMYMSYVDVRDGVIRTQLRPDSPWKDNFYRIEGDLIYWNQDGQPECPWRAISREKLPTWFGSFQEKAHSRMNEREAAFRRSQSQTEQDGDGGPSVVES
jgi:hypothetical protein